MLEVRDLHAYYGKSHILRAWICISMPAKW